MKPIHSSLLSTMLSLIFGFWGLIATAATVAVHDPSIIVAYIGKDGRSYPEQSPSNDREKRYYLFGTHRGGAYSTDLINWKEFSPKFSSDNMNAVFGPAVAWSSLGINNYDLNGNLWAPDIIYNPTMQKWCLYFSVNGDAEINKTTYANSVISLLTADHIEGPYTYQDEVIYSGFTASGTYAYTKTDFADVVERENAPSLINNYTKNDGTLYSRSIKPHAIDPAVTYDQEGNLWMIYGSWSGGIWMIRLNPRTGLRDNTYSAPGYDKYCGFQIAGGAYVSGEGSYIEYMEDADGNGYYYLFVSYGFYSPEGGYNMRMFRSKNIEGPYSDPTGDSPVFKRYVLNYGDNVQYGVSFMQNYTYPWWKIGQTAQGHNSALMDEDGSCFVIYHAKENTGTIYHNVEVHQLFFNEAGWPIAAPFEYRKGFGISKKVYTTEDLAGAYGLIIHNSTDYAKLVCNQAQDLYLDASGRVSGALSGEWSYNYADGKQYLTINSSKGTFQCVLAELLMDGLSTQTTSFTGMDNGTELCIWGYKKATTSTGSTTHYGKEELIIGPRDFSLEWFDYDKFHKESVSGDFDLEFSFINRTKDEHVWDNWAVGLSDGTSRWHQRADAYSNETFTNSSVNYQKKIEGELSFKDKEVTVKIQRRGNVIDLYVYADGSLYYTATALNCPTKELEVYLGGEACYLEVSKISKSKVGNRISAGSCNADGTYPIGFNKQKCGTTTVSGDFELEYQFNNYRNPISEDPWDNYIITASADGQEMFVRADDYCFDIFGETTSEKDWEWEDFLSLMSNAQITANIKREGDVINYKITISAQNGKVYNYQVINTHAPTSPITFNLTCEESFIDLMRIETIETIGETITQNNPSPTPLADKVTSDGSSIFIHSRKDQKSQLYSIEGKLIGTFQLTEGWNKISHLGNGTYLILGQKVVLFKN